jgi:hypothetical protein
MTPELKIACEVVFQEHKTSHPISWNKDIFRGRVSIGLSEKAKETLVSKNVIYFPNRAKKAITVLNPSVAAAATFEEAVEIVQNKLTASVSDIIKEQPAYTEVEIPAFINRSATYTHRVIEYTDRPETAVVAIKWYMKPVFCYILWPLCAIVVGAGISYLMTEYIAEIFR